MAARENRENSNWIFSQNMAYKVSFLGSLGMKSLFFLLLSVKNIEDGRKLCWVFFSFLKINLNSSKNAIAETLVYKRVVS